MSTALPSDLASLAACLLPSELAVLVECLAPVGAHIANPGPDPSAVPRIDVVFDQDDDAGETNIRVFVDGNPIHWRHHTHSDTEPLVRFHVLDSGPFDELQPHAWAQQAMAAARHAPDGVRSYIAARVLEYHQPERGDGCLLGLTGDPGPAGSGISTSGLDNLPALTLLQLRCLISEKLEAHYLDDVKAAMRDALKGVEVAGVPVSEVDIPAERVGGPAGWLAYDRSKVRFRCGGSAWMTIDLRDFQPLRDALGALVGVAPIEDDDDVDPDLTFDLR
ncbi:hypothetical protein [Streptomyces sp. MJM8645]|uniref:hypothetical protein n=1 Tax=Streptomycetaceae TaxID=2062 RepID=UPI0007AFBD07|nr:hypothetical protein [Streptomyces sp. MJM8645]